MRAKSITDAANNFCVPRYGYVSDFDPDRMMARVRFPDLGDLISGWLPVGVMNSLNNHDEFALDIDEHVFCIMMGSGVEEGIILAAIYDDKNKPSNKNREQRYTKFQDETEIYYDRDKHKLHAKFNDDTNIYYDGQTHELRAENSQGSFIRMQAGELELHGENHVSITAPRIDLN